MSTYLRFFTTRLDFGRSASAFVFDFRRDHPEELARDPTYIVKVLRDGSERAAAVTEAVLRDVRRALALDP